MNIDVVGNPQQLWDESQARLEELPAFELITRHYEGRSARRSGLPYINHIREGAYVLYRCFGDRPVLTSAFCIHPILQNNRSLLRAVSGEVDLSGIGWEAIVLAMEYRHIANGFLSTRRMPAAEDIRLSPLVDVQALLVADKVQNKKDFVRHISHGRNAGASERASAHYLAYFDSWLERLGVNQAAYERLEAELNQVGS